MRHRLAIAAVCAGSILGSAAHVMAWPIPPQTLLELTNEADLVVLATVSKVEEHKSTGEDDWDSHVATLELKDVWKEKPPSRAGVPGARDRLRVRFTESLCPAPPRFEPLLDVLAFLVHDKDGSYAVAGLSYGTLYPEYRDVPWYRRLVKQAAEIQQGNPSLTASAHTEWSVTAAEAPATRWHGLYGLNPRNDHAHAFYEDGRRIPQSSLSDEQQQRLMRAFVDKPLLDITLPMMLSLFEGRPSNDVDRTAVAAIDTLLDAGAVPYWLGRLVGLTYQRLGKRPPPPPAKPKGSPLDAAMAEDPLLAGMDFDARVVRKEWRALRRTLPYPARRLRLPLRKAVEGVGEDTPP